MSQIATLVRATAGKHQPVLRCRLCRRHRRAEDQGVAGHGELCLPRQQTKGAFIALRGPLHQERRLRLGVPRLRPRATGREGNHRAPRRQSGDGAPSRCPLDGLVNSSPAWPTSPCASFQHFLTKHGDAYRRAGRPVAITTPAGADLSSTSARWPRLPMGSGSRCRISIARSIIAGVIFHDCGKISKTSSEARLRHVLPQGGDGPWAYRRLASSSWKRSGLECNLNPKNDRLLILRHLILSHHGKLDWGSPVEPMCPEAAVLHYVDQISAKTEMFKAMYLSPRSRARPARSRLPRPR